MLIPGSATTPVLLYGDVAFVVDVLLVDIPLLLMPVLELVAVPVAVVVGAGVAGAGVAGAIHRIVASRAHLFASGNASCSVAHFALHPYGASLSVVRARA